MGMDAQAVAMVQKSFEKVAPLGDTVTEIFYGELFAIDPSLRPMFKGDMREQRRMLMSALALVVRSLHAPQAILEPVKAMAKRHVAYGVEPVHYALVGNALLRTLEKGLGDDFTPELREAWTGAYGMLSGVMKDAAYGADSASKSDA
jgi:hemoglobin-like flavoprotein